MPTSAEPYATPWIMLSRWFALLSGTLSTLASKCVANLVAGPSPTVDLKGACVFTSIMLGIFCVLAALFYSHKKALNAAIASEKKEGILDLTPSQTLDLTVDEGITNLTSAIASVVAGLWFGFMPTLTGPMDTLMIAAGGSLILVLGEFIQRSLKKGSMGEYIVSLLNGMNCGNVSWWVGNSMCNNQQRWFGAAEGESPALDYWMWGVALLIAAVNLEFFNFISTKTGQSGDSKPYGAFIFSMLKGVPMYSSGLLLSNIVQYRYESDYVVGTLIWMTISTVFVVIFDQFVHKEHFKGAHGSCYADEKVVFKFRKEVVTLLGQTFAFICGQLAAFALGGFIPAGSISLWCSLAVLCQVLAFIAEGARTQYFPVLSKDASKHT